MLLITRRPGEAIVVNGSITVKVVDIRGGRVKLGFEFPNGNTVYREELFEKIQAENRAAALPGLAQENATQKPLQAVLKAIPTQVGTGVAKRGGTADSGNANNKDHKDATGTAKRAGRDPDDHDE